MAVYDSCSIVLSRPLNEEIEPPFKMLGYPLIKLLKVSPLHGNLGKSVLLFSVFQILHLFHCSALSRSALMSKSKDRRSCPKFFSDSQKLCTQEQCVSVHNAHFKYSSCSSMYCLLCGPTLLLMGFYLNRISSLTQWATQLHKYLCWHQWGRNVSMQQGQCEGKEMPSLGRAVTKRYLS